MRQYKLKKCKRVHGLHFTPDCMRLLAVGGEEVRMVDCAVWLDLATGENTGRSEKYAQCYAVDPALSRYVLGGADGWDTTAAGVQWMELPVGKKWQTFPSRKRKVPPRFTLVSGLAFDAIGKKLAISHARASGRRGELIYQLTVTQGDSADERVDLNPDAQLGVLAFNADATRLAVTGGVDGVTAVSVYELASRERVYRFEPDGTVTRCLQFLPDGRLVVANGRFLYTLLANGDTQYAVPYLKQVNAVTLAPDGRRVLSASHDGLIRVWDANTGEAGPTFDWKIGPITALAFAPDGLTCAAAGLNGKIVLWDVDE